MQVPQWLEDLCERLRQRWGADRVYVVDAEAEEGPEGPQVHALFLGARGVRVSRAEAEAQASTALGEALGQPVTARLLTGPEEEVEFLLDRYLREYIASHGGAVTLTRVDEAGRRAWVRFEGGCSGCPASLLTLTLGIERTLRKHLPWLKKVEAENRPEEPDFGIRLDYSVSPGRGTMGGGG